MVAEAVSVVAGVRYGGSVLTVGVDLAAQAATTAIAHVRWSAGGALVIKLVVDVDDDAVVAGGRTVAGGRRGHSCGLTALSTAAPGRTLPP